uniref:NS7a protein n=1 Tax=Eidolon bat coronavirus TaxID=2717680 RepID=A0AB38ZDQ0_9NIDO
MRLFLLILSLSLPFAHCFNVAFRLHAICTDYPDQYCKQVNIPCDGAVITYQRGIDGLQLCLQVTAVPYREVGNSHLFTLIDPFGRYMCTHTQGVTTLPSVKWGQKHLLLTVLAKSDQFVNLPCSGQIARIRQGSSIVTLCVQTAGWQFGELLRQYMVRTERHCALFTYALPLHSEGVYYKDEL